MGECQFLPQQQFSQEILEENSLLLINEGSVDESRGLEYIIFRERQMDKDMVVRIILNSQRKMKSLIAIATQKDDPDLRKMIKLAPLKLALISMKCTRWARNIALATGKLDCADVYENTLQANPQFLKSFEGHERFPLKKRNFMLEDSSSSNITQKRKRSSRFEISKTKGTDIRSNSSDTNNVG